MDFFSQTNGFLKKKKILFIFFIRTLQATEGEKGGVLHGVSWMGGWIKGKREREGGGIENRPGVCVRRWGHGAGVNGGIIFALGSWGPLSSCG